MGLILDEFRNRIGKIYGVVLVLMGAHVLHCVVFFFSSRRRHTRFDCDWSSDVCSSDLLGTDSDRMNCFCISSDPNPCPNVFRATVRSMRVSCALSTRLVAPTPIVLTIS